MVVTTIEGIEGLKSKVGTHLGFSAWRQITQGQVDDFAEATGDFQFIHVDVERAKAGPFGGTIAHGYLTLSLAPSMTAEIMRVTGVSMAINYGCGKVRFPSPVPVGSRIRCGAELTDVDDVSGGVQVQMALTFEIEGSEKPACVAEAIYRYYE